MKTLKTVLDRLSTNDRNLLLYAFENSMSQYVEYEHGRFIGVNCDPIKHLHPELKAGHWSEGIIKGNRNGGK